MKKLIIGIVVIVGLVIGLGVYLSKYQNTSASKTSGKVKVGDIAPDFSLPATTGKTITLSEYKDKQNVLIYFHEGLSCDPCIQQMPALDKISPDLEKMNVALLSMAVDSVEEMNEAAPRYGGFNHPVLSYKDARTEVDYDLLPFSMAMGRRAGHTFILVGTDSIVKWRKDYWPEYGMMVNSGVMFVEPQEILTEVKTVLGQ